MNLQHRSRRKFSAGFTLIELMLAVVVIAVIVAVALPSYRDSVRKSRRAEGIAALSAVQQTQERWRGNQAEYGSLANLGSINEAVRANTPNGHYSISVSDASSSGYTARATGSNDQANDGACGILAVRVSGGTLSYGSGRTTVDWSDPGRCWAK